MADTTTRIYELQVKLAQDSLNQLKKLSSSAGALEKQFGKLEAKATEFGNALLAAVSVGALVAAIDHTISKFDEMAAAAQRIGMGVETFSALTYAAEQSDASMEDLSIGLKELNKSMVEIGTKGANVLDALGIDKSKPQLEVLKEFADKFQGIDDEALKTNALLEVFGKNGLKLRPLLDQGSDAIERLMGSASALGAVLSEDLAKAISDLDNVIKDSKAQTEGFGKELVGGLAPALTDVLQALQGAGEGGQFFEMVGTALGVVLRGLTATALVVGQVFKQTGAFIYGVAASAFKLLSGDVAGAKNEIESLDERLKENARISDAAIDRTLGLAKADDAAGDSKIRHTRAVEDYTAKTRAALAAKEKETKATKEQITEYEKLIKALDDQIARLALIATPMSEYEQALAQIARLAMTITAAQFDAAMAEAKRVKTLDDLNKKMKEHADLLEKIDSVTQGLRTEEERFLDDIREYQLLAAKVAADDKLTADEKLARTEELQEAERRRTQQYLEGMAKSKDATEETNKLLEALADKVDGYAKKISDALIDFATGAQGAKFSFSDFVMSALRDLAKMVTQMLLIEPLIAELKKSLKDIGGSGGSSPVGALADIAVAALQGKALGGVYTSPSLSAYSGGVYTEPRVFKFAHGAGVFAEAGPEAIMPLTRGADGSLGVDASGAGGVTVNVYNEARAEVTTTARDVNGQRVVDVLVKDAVARGIRSGAFDAVMGHTYGLNRMGAR